MAIASLWSADCLCTYVARPSSMMTTEIQIPDRLWEKPLFTHSAEFVRPDLSLSFSRIDYRLRCSRHMPSTGDATTPRFFTDLKKIKSWSAQWLESLPADAVGSQAREALQRIDRLGRAMDSGLSPQSLALMLQSLKAQIPAELHSFVPADSLPIMEQRGLLEILYFVVLEKIMDNTDGIRKRYLNRMYRSVDQSLCYNATSDVPRMIPVIGWIRQMLVSDQRRQCSYVDVGCSFSGGALGAVLAARLLRHDSVCASIHATDIMPIEKDLQRKWLLENHVVAYQSDPVSRPLPRAYDVILLANVHRHLTTELQHALLQNLVSSLHDGGMLFVAWRFKTGSHQCLCLARNGPRLEIRAEANLI